MKRKIVLLSCMALLALCLTGCGTFGMASGIYAGYTEPVAVAANELGTKVGEAKTVNVLGLVAVGDAAIKDAAKKAGITRISHIDKKVISVLGLFTIHKYLVYGE